MSNHPVSARALLAVSLVTALACASGSPKDTSSGRPLYEIDSSTAIGDGRSMEDLFAGRFPGVTATRADGGGLQIRIRGGSNTFYGNDEPLFVIDETPVAVDSRGIVFLNPHDIQKIEVLKNPADTGVYGMRGANGVVKITTRRAGRESR